MRSLVVLLLLGSASAQEFIPDTTGLDGAIGAVMALVLTLATVGIVVSITWFVVQLWMHRGT